MIQPGYLPWLGFFEQIYKVDLLVVLDDVQYTKGSWRNRHKIRTKQGWSWLSVPVFQKGRFGQLISDTKIDNTKKWAKRHWNCLRENYYQSRYWERYSPFFEILYKSKWCNLVRLDMEIIHFCVNDIGIETDIVLSSSLSLGDKFKKKCENKGDATDRNIFYIQELGGKIFYEGALGKKFLGANRFSQAGIELIFQDYKHPVYEQRFNPFIPYLSIVDLLFNHGPQSLDILLCKQLK